MVLTFAAMKRGLLLCLALPLTLGLTQMVRGKTASPSKTGGYTVRFAPLPIPATVQEKKDFLVSPYVDITDPQGTTKRYPLKFHVFYRSGWKDFRGVVGGLLTNNLRQPIVRDGKPRVTPKPDGNTILSGPNGPVLFTQFEDRPSALYSAPIGQRSDGSLRPLRLDRLDYSPLGGMQHTCAASRTPWNTHLVPEEDYELDAFFFDDKTKKLSATHEAWCKKDGKGRFTGAYQAPPFSPDEDHSGWCKDVLGTRDELQAGLKTFNPYNYGYLAELQVGKDSRPHIRYGHKLYVFGKATPEMGLVMPDRRTVYTTDDGEHRGIYMMQADKPGDLRRGTLYMAKWRQTSNVNGGSANLSWVRLGHGDSLTIRGLIRRNLSFTDLFDARPVENCPLNQGFKVVLSGDPRWMCLRLRDGKHGSTLSRKFRSGAEARNAAAFLEKRKLGALLGATSEFSKLEGITFDPDHNSIYLAVSGITDGMADQEGGREPMNDVRLPLNSCGAVYGLSLRRQRGMQGPWIATSMKGLVSGRPLKPGDPASDLNSCDPNLPGNPDNMRYLPQTNTLLIGEDTSAHVNNYVFAYNVVNKSLTRVMSMPSGGEFAGTFSPLVWRGKSYLFINSQYALDSQAFNAEGKVSNQDALDAAAPSEKGGVVGYLGGFPAMPWWEP